MGYKILDKEKNHVIVKMDIKTYEMFSKGGRDGLNELSKNARKTKSYNNLEDLFYDLES